MTSQYKFYDRVHYMYFETNKEIWYNWTAHTKT